MKKILYLLCLAGMICSCNNSVKPQQETAAEDSVTIENTIGKLREMHIQKEITLAGKKYKYRYDFACDESLPVVRNPQGDDYYDNKVTLRIEHNGKEFFNRTFTKTDFSQIVPKNFMQSSALIGFTYNYTSDENSDALYFIATVGDPDESADMTFPIQLHISPDGNLKMEKAVNLDTEPINPMTLDPADDIGV